MNKETLDRIECRFIEKAMEECEHWDPKAVLAYLDGAVKAMAAVRKELTMEEKGVQSKKKPAKRKVESPAGNGESYRG